jgi:hypothetical protein
MAGTADLLTFERHAADGVHLGAAVHRLEAAVEAVLTPVGRVELHRVGVRQVGGAGGRSPGEAVPAPDQHSRAHAGEGHPGRVEPATVQPEIDEPLGNHVADLRASGLERVAVRGQAPADDLRV